MVASDRRGPPTRRRRSCRVHPRLAGRSAICARMAPRHGFASIPPFAVDAHARTITASAELARLLAVGDEPFEMSVEEYRNTFVQPDDRESSAQMAEDGYRSGKPVSWERRLIRADGEVIWETSHAGYELDEQR